MDGFFSKEGRAPALDLVTADANAAWRFLLFKTDRTYDADYAFSAGDEATYSGYSRITPVFGASALDGDDYGSSDADQVVFAHNGGGTANTIHAFGLIHHATGKLRFVVPLVNPVTGDPAPKSMALSGDAVAITGTLKAKPG